MPPKSVKLAIAGSFGYMDIGDEAMLTEDLWFIRNHLNVPKENVHLFGENLRYLSSYHEHPKTHCHPSAKIQRNWEVLELGRNWKKRLKRGLLETARLRMPPNFDTAFHKLVSSCTAALITGGGTINTRDENSTSLSRMHAMISYFHHCKLPVFLSGQTIGPLGIHSGHDQMAREIIEKVDVLTARDSRYSRRYMDLVGARPRQFLETFDDAYTLEYENIELPKDCLQFLAGDETIAVNVTDYTGNSQGHRIFMARLCQRLIEEDRKQVLLVSHAPRDLQNLHVIYDMVPNRLKSRIHVPDTRIWKDAMLKKLISCCKVAIGGRYHFIVFAGTSNTPFVGMCGNHYSYIKQDGFARPLGLEDFVLTESEVWDGNILWDRYLRAKDLKLDAGDRFARPSASMRLFEEWLQKLP